MYVRCKSLILLVFLYGNDRWKFGKDDAIEYVARAEERRKKTGGKEKKKLTGKERSAKE